MRIIFIILVSLSSTLSFAASDACTPHGCGIVGVANRARGKEAAL